jgi:hypothetical protein
MRTVRSSVVQQQACCSENSSLAGCCSRAPGTDGSMLFVRYCSKPPPTGVVVVSWITSILFCVVGESALPLM